MSCLATLGLRVLIDLRKGSKCSVGCGLAVFLLGVMCPMVAWHLFLLPWVYQERFGWQGFIFMVFEWASLLGFQLFMYPRCVDRSAVPLVELWSLWFLVLLFGRQGSSDRGVWVEKWRLPGGGFWAAVVTLGAITFCRQLCMNIGILQCSKLR